MGAAITLRQGDDGPGNLACIWPRLYLELNHISACSVTVVYHLEHFLVLRKSPCGACGVYRGALNPLREPTGTACRRGGADAAGCVMTDGLDWRVAIVGYDRIQWARYLNAYARQSGEPEPSMDDGRRETHFAQYRACR